MTAALVSFERVFEVLDVDPLLKEPARPHAAPDRPAVDRVRDVRFTYPAADKVSLASLEEVAVLDDTVGEEVVRGVDRDRAGPPGRARRIVRRRQVDAGRSRPPPLRRRRGRSDSVASTSASWPSTTSAPRSAS